ncbi:MULTISPECIES: FMN-binding glutamate synthase family protein [unclassified Nocardioides]|uniref:FMN-binding glutamate synthase family protein n=1 Tax=unclassified Nocardioides TaxID=2615069 RepID=UPI0030143502
MATHDLLQRRHAILRNFPVLGHARFLLEAIGPELRQYIVAANDEERPFSRDQRRWVYASSKLQNNYFGFGTDNDLEHSDGNVVVHHRTFSRSYPTHGVVGQVAALPAAKVLGGPRGRRHAFRPDSVVNISGMSFGSLSGNAIEALNRGAASAGVLHNTGEGAVSPHHRHGGELVFQVGTAYFGCRDEQGRFDLGRLKDLVAGAPVRAIEIKLSQGAKPGLGGVLPAEKVSREIADTRGVPIGVDCLSPSRHSEFDDVDSLLDFIELIADETGLPVGIKSAVGDLGFWRDLTDTMASESRGVDFVTIDGGEGGTGASPLVFTDSVALPFRLGFARVYAEFARRGLHEDVTFIGAGKLGLPDNALVAFALGADLVNVGREAMFAVGCVQAQKCHTGGCPTGVATQNPWLTRGLDPVSKADRVANYLKTLRRDLLKVSETCGVEHPSLIGPVDIEVLSTLSEGRLLHDVYGYEPGWSLPSVDDRRSIIEIMSRTEEPESRTEGPPETSETGPPAREAAGSGGLDASGI